MRKVKLIRKRPKSRYNDIEFGSKTKIYTGGRLRNPDYIDTLLERLRESRIATNRYHTEMHRASTVYDTNNLIENNNNELESTESIDPSSTWNSFRGYSQNTEEQESVEPIQENEVSLRGRRLENQEQNENKIIENNSQTFFERLWNW